MHDVSVLQSRLQVNARRHEFNPTQQLISRGDTGLVALVLLGKFVWASSQEAFLVDAAQKLEGRLAAK